MIDLMTEDINEVKRMSAFEKIIGYEGIKNELKQVCDMIHNREDYEKLGAKLPSGVLLYGKPGIGKTLMAKALIEESGLKTFVVRRNKGSDDFVDVITKTFEDAKNHAPSIIFLDDMDKFANEDDMHRDAEEYVAVQSGIDEVKGSGVFVIATVNAVWKLPGSLTRLGRFDRKFEINPPTRDEAAQIIKYYISDKKVSDDINMEDICNMISYSSCAELETILNEAAINAGFKRKEYVETEDIVDAVLKIEYDSPDNYSVADEEELRKTALHEAGHAVVSEVILPGSIGLVSLRISGKDSVRGFTRQCKVHDDPMDHIYVGLGGKAAHELFYNDGADPGSVSDLSKATELITKEVRYRGTCGIGMTDVWDASDERPSDPYRSKIETVVSAELEKAIVRARKILQENEGFLKAVQEALLEKETLLYSDIKEIREKFSVH